MMATKQVMVKFSDQGATIFKLTLYIPVQWPDLVEQISHVSHFVGFHLSQVYELGPSLSPQKKPHHAIFFNFGFS